MIFDVGGGEFLAIIVIAVVLFGPDKVPELVKKASRVIAYLRGIANSATDTLKSQLGPEFADMTAADLQPKRLLERTLLRDVQADLDGIKAQVDSLKEELTGQFDPINADLQASVATARTGLSGLEAAINGAAATLNRAVEATEADDDEPADAEIVDGPSTDQPGATAGEATPVAVPEP